MNPIIIDNALPQSLADEFELMLASSAFPWYFVADVTFAKDKVGTSVPAFQHSYYNPDEGSTSAFFNPIAVIPNIVLDKIGYTNRPHVIRCKSFLQLPLIRNDDYTHNSTHLDLPIPHVVCLYYVNDTDGDTYIYDTNNEKLIERITPRKNRAVVFDGLCYHASSLPTKDKRIIINFDLDTNILNK